MTRRIARRVFLKAVGALGMTVAPVFLTACSAADTEQPDDTVAPGTGTPADTASQVSPETDPSTAATDAGLEEDTTPSEGGESLVLVFSRADENYRVGYIETGNTMVLAQFIQQKTGADMFELKPATPYPAEYDACIDQALEEQHQGSRPALQEVPDLTTYSTIYFGFPCWWGDIPMPVYTAIEALNWQGKTIAPFNTHEGSGSAGMFGTLAEACTGSTVFDGLTVQGTVAQNERENAERQVDEWLSKLEV